MGELLPTGTSLDFSSKTRALNRLTRKDVECGVG